MLYRGMEREEKRGRKTTFAGLVDSGIFRVKTRVLDSQKLNVSRNSMSYDSEKDVLVCFVLLCFVLNKILFFVLDVVTVEFHLTLQALPSSLKQTCLSLPGFGRTLASQHILPTAGTDL